MNQEGKVLLASIKYLGLKKAKAVKMALKASSYPSLWHDNGILPRVLGNLFLYNRTNRHAPRQPPKANPTKFVSLLRTREMRKKECRWNADMKYEVTFYCLLVGNVCITWFWSKNLWIYHINETSLRTSLPESPSWAGLLSRHEKHLCNLGNSHSIFL